MSLYTDNYPNNIESPQRVFIQYSQDIEFDYSEGKFPSGEEDGFLWEDYFIPVNHNVGGVVIGNHVWRREKVGSNGIWTSPQAIGITEENYKAIVEDVINNLKVKAPIAINVDGELEHLETEPYLHLPTEGTLDQILKMSNTGAKWQDNEVTSLISTDYPIYLNEFNRIAHLNTDGFKHVPSGGNMDQVLTQSVTGPIWQSPSITLGDVYTRTELNTDTSAEIHWNNLTNVPTMLHDDTSNISDTANIEFNIVRNLTFDNYGHVLTEESLDLKSNSVGIKGDSSKGISTYRVDAPTVFGLYYNPFENVNYEIALNFNDNGNGDDGIETTSSRKDHKHDLVYQKLTDTPVALVNSEAPTIANLGKIRYRNDGLYNYIEVVMLVGTGVNISYEWVEIVKKPSTIV